MNDPSMDNVSYPTKWNQFWHKPVRAERLALTRILLALSLLTDQLFQYLPNLEEFFGPTGMAPKGLHDAYQLRHWRITVLLFNHDEPWVVQPLFTLWVGLTFCWLIGWQTRVMNVFVWFLTLLFINRNPNILNGGDDTMQVALFLLMLSPCGRALSVDSWLRHRREGPAEADYTPAWPVRLIQIQLCLIYVSTGLVKLQGTGPFEGTWWEGTSIHYVLNYVTMSRWAFTQFPQPFWLTSTLTYLSVWWEVLFPLLVLFRWTRTPALVFGLLFHQGIWFTIEVGWFSFYTMSYYGVWVPCWFWERLSSPASSAPQPVAASASPR